MQHGYLDFVTHVGKSISILSQNTDAISYDSSQLRVPSSSNHFFQQVPNFLNLISEMWQILMMRLWQMSGNGRMSRQYERT